MAPARLQLPGDKDYFAYNILHMEHVIRDDTNRNKNTMKLHTAHGKNTFCGPCAMSSMTGLSTDQIVDLVQQLRGNRRPVKGMFPTEVAKLMQLLGCPSAYERTLDHNPGYGIGVADGCPTLAQWLKVNGARPGMFLLWNRKHFILYSSGMLMDSGVVYGRKPLPVELAVKWRRARIEGCYWFNERPAQFEPQEMKTYAAEASAAERIDVALRSAASKRTAVKRALAKGDLDRAADMLQRAVNFTAEADKLTSSLIGVARETLAVCHRMCDRVSRSEALNVHLAELLDKALNPQEEE